MKIKYYPAQLVKAAQGWYVKFYQTDPATGQLKRFRQTFDLNRISDKKIRLARARQIIADINLRLPGGFPFTNGFSSDAYQTIREAVTFAHKVKTQTDRARTISMYDSLVNVFLGYLEEKKIDSLELISFGRAQALAFMDYLTASRGVGPRTYNNYLIRIKALFQALVDREWILQNPFSGIDKKTVPSKKRRPFVEYEKKAVARYIQETDYWLFLAVLLQYYCYIRPAEIRRLRFSNFRLQEGIIFLPGEITKTKKSRSVTIPKKILPVFRSAPFTDHPVNFLIFGAGVKPHPNKQCGHNTMNWRHQKVLEHLKRVGEIHDITNLSFYSWKDTGLTDSKASLFSDMKQAGHQDPKITLIYKREGEINEEQKSTQKELI